MYATHSKSSFCIDAIATLSPLAQQTVSDAMKFSPDHPQPEMEEGTNIPYPSSSSRSQNEIARRAGQENKKTTTNGIKNKTKNGK
jgi:hypothetical protein